MDERAGAADEELPGTLVDGRAAGGARVDARAAGAGRVDARAAGGILRSARFGLKIRHLEKLERTHQNLYR